MKLKTFFLTIFVLLKRRSIALAFTVGLLSTVAPMQVLGQSRAYVANVDATSVSVIDTDPDSDTFNTAVDTIPLGAGTSPRGVAITPDGSRVYTADAFSDAVLVIDTDPGSDTFNTVVDDIPIPGGGPFPWGVAITPGPSAGPPPGPPPGVPAPPGAGPPPGKGRPPGAGSP